MKSMIQKAILTTSLLAGLSAHAEVKPVGVKINTARAHMEITSKTGNMETIESVTITEGELNQVPNSKYFTVLFSAPNARFAPVDFTVVNTEVDTCGSVTYTALPPRRGFDMPEYSLELVDHRSRLCEDYRPYAWTAEIVYSGGFIPQVYGTMSLVGHPEYLAVTQ